MCKESLERECDQIKLKFRVKIVKTSVEWEEESFVIEKSEKSHLCPFWGLQWCENRLEMCLPCVLSKGHSNSTRILAFWNPWLRRNRKNSAEEKKSYPKKNRVVVAKQNRVLCKWNKNIFSSCLRLLAWCVLLQSKKRYEFSVSSSSLRNF